MYTAVSGPAGGLASPTPGILAPREVRYIKLGAGGAWEGTALKEGTLEWGTPNEPAALLAAGEWDALRAHYIAQGVGKAVATSFTREARDFHTLGADTLWITFARGQLWWCCAEPRVAAREGAVGERQATHFRRTVDGWHNTDVRGRELATSDLSTRLTMLSAYRQTICAVGARAYLLRVLNAEEEPSLVLAQDAIQALEKALQPLVQGLHQSEFELFVDLLFAAMAWRRVSVLGGTMKDIDLLLELPATGERAAVQVKSTAGQGVLDGCVQAFRASRQADRFFFVTHSAVGSLNVGKDRDDARNIDVLDGAGLARATVRYGLTHWLMRRAN